MNKILLIFMLCLTSIFANKTMGTISSKAVIENDREYLIIEIKNDGDEPIKFLQHDMSEEFGIFAGYFISNSGKRIPMTPISIPISVSPYPVSILPKEERQFKISLGSLFEDTSIESIREMIIFFSFELNILDPKIKYPETRVISRIRIGGYASWIVSE